MSIASISYKSLKNASDEANGVAKKYDKYADSLYGDVYKKLSNCNMTSNISTACYNTNAKINELRTEQSRYNAYSSDLKALREKCGEVDKAVRSKVSSLTASFKASHGIRNSAIENTISYYFTSNTNKTRFGRWLDRKKDEYDMGSDYIKDSIKAWYNYDGGKEFIKGVLEGALEVVIGVLSIAAAILSGGSLLVIIAGVIAGAIYVVNGFANMDNEARALNTTHNGDPATGRRRSKINSIQDYLRSSFAYGDNGEKYEYDEFKNGIALGIDIVNTACVVVTLISSAGKLLKNGYKWATGKSAENMKDVFSKDAFGKFTSKIKMNIQNGIKDIKMSFKFHDWSKFKNFGKSNVSDCIKTIKNKFWKFDTPKNDTNSIKNMLSVSKNVIEGGFDVKNILKVGLTGIVIPSITAFTVPGDLSLEVGPNGQLQINLFDEVTIGDFAGIITNGCNIFTFFDELNGGSIINIDIPDNLSGVSDIDISIPQITVPDITLPVLRSA